ncbi:hypothetical protein Tsp_14466 [Trichinella spiralis]|uniref:hypothetical protein n=1 Tax=Trichinella spiralis TaxID=6334 RepID=UPI0001EFEDAD|nr:hypothetical protein Tsp_14466 [Trichinella spiralis]
MAWINNGVSFCVVRQKSFNLPNVDNTGQNYCEKGPTDIMADNMGSLFLTQVSFANVVNKLYLRVYPNSQQKYCEETYCSRTVVVCLEMTNRYNGNLHRETVGVCSPKDQQISWLIT